MARLGAKFAGKTGESFATNFVADSAGSMLNQAVTGQQVTVGDDLVNGSRAALGTALFTGGSATLAEAAGPAGAAGRMLRGDGLLGTTVNGAAGHVAGGLTAEVRAGKDGSALAWDAGTNALTGGLGNARNLVEDEKETAKGE